MTAPVNLYWDSCIFIRYLSGSNADAHYGDICQYVEEAKGKDPRWKIHFSTLVYAEMRPEYLKKGGFGSIEEFFSDLGKAFYPIEPNPNILIAAGELHSAKPVDSSNPKKPVPSNRTVGTPDAIHLMSCVFARDVMGIDDIIFHSTDTGRGATWEGKCVPLIGFEKWFPDDGSRSRRVKEACSLKRTLPFHPQPVLAGVVRNAPSSVVPLFGAQGKPA